MTTSKIKYGNMWSAHLPQKDQKAFQESVMLVLNSTAIDRLRNLIEAHIVDTYDNKEPDYTDTSWAYRQAHKNGERQALIKVLQLLEIKES